VIEVRRAQPQEHETLTAIAHASKRYWGYPEEWLELWDADLTFSKESIAERDTYCAIRDHKIVGVYALEVSDGEAELWDFWVLPGFMGKGVGRRLFGHAVDIARGRGARQLRIESDPHAAEFYRRMGAHDAGEAPSRPEGRTLPLLRLDL
jgi:GNAT superfamily N-acetyltransferase